MMLYAGEGRPSVYSSYTSSTTLLIGNFKKGDPEMEGSTTIENRIDIYNSE